jgi:hypothetical protein
VSCGSQKPDLHRKTLQQEVHPSALFIMQSQNSNLSVVKIHLKLKILKRIIWPQPHKKPLAIFQNSVELQSPSAYAILQTLVFEKMKHKLGRKEYSPS